MGADPLRPLRRSSAPAHRADRRSAAWRQAEGAGPGRGDGRGSRASGASGRSGEEREARCSARSPGPGAEEAE